VQLWRDLADVPAGFGPSVVTIGNFDGVHRGHATVLTRLCADARAVGARAVAVTFSPHPLQVHRPDDAPELLTGDDDRLELLATTGLDAVLLLPYTLEFARQTPQEFVRRYLVDGLRARTVVVGRDVRFGWENSGDLSTMVALGERYGFAVEVISDVTPPEHAADPAHRRWSSTWVRELLGEGDVAAAARVLGRAHRLRGTVVHGDARGRELGFPTANLGPDTAGMVPADGVYAGWLRRTRRADGAAVAADEPDAVLPAAVSIGTNPTFDGVERRVEAYVLDRDDLDLYDQQVVLELVERLRPTLRFDGPDAIERLVATMRDDVARAREVLGTDPPGARPARGRVAGAAADAGSPQAAW
jgi:riboflavin kinase/FMN adenylyltransferase